MLVANAVVDTDQPRLQVGENQMDDRQVLLGNLWITTLGNSEVLIAALTEASIAAPIVSNDQRSRRDGALDEPTERLGATVEHDGEPNASGIASVFPVVELGARLSMTHLDGTGDGNLVVNTTAFPTRSPANPGFVHLNMVLGLSTDPVLVGPHHARAELVENLKGRLVARKTKLPLKLHGGHAGRLTGDQISGPEPDVQRSVATLHHCSHRQPGVLAALAAAQDARAVFKVERLSRRAAVRAGKAVSPAGFLQVGGAGRIIGEKSLELGYLFSEDPLAQGNDEEDLARFCTWYNVQNGYNNFLETVEKLYEDEQRRERRLAAAAEAAGEVEISADDRTPLSPEQLGRLENFLERADLSSVLRRQHVCAVIGENPPQSIFKELFVSINDLATTVLPDVNLVANRWLFQHLTQTLDRRVLKLLSRADDSDLFSSFSMNLNIDTLLHPDFIEFDKSLRTGSRGTIVIELQPVDVFADYNAFMFARDFAREKGYRICLDGVGINFFKLIDRKLLEVDLVKLVWTSDLSNDANQARHEEMTEHIAEIGKSRVILSRCDTPAAIRLGQNLGITMFQGRYIDSLLQGQRNYIPAPKMAPLRRATSH